MRTGSLQSTLREDADHLTGRWWTVALRGVAAIAFGILSLIWPGSSLLFLVMLFGAYAIVDGVLDLMLAARKGRAGQKWGWFVVEGLVSMAAGVVTLFWPGITAVILLYVIAFWAIAHGIAAIISAIQLRKVIHNEVWLGLSGVLQIAFGILVFMNPGSGALAIAVWIGIFAIFLGAMLLALGFRLRSAGHKPEQRLPGRSRMAAPV